MALYRGGGHVVLYQLAFLLEYFSDNLRHLECPVGVVAQTQIHDDPYGTAQLYRQDSSERERGHQSRHAWSMS